MRVSDQNGDVVRRVDGHLLRAHHADLGVFEHAHHVFHRVLVGNGIAALDDTDFTLSNSQKFVDGRGLALAPLLFNQQDARILGHELLDDRHRVVGARAGHHHNFADLNLVHMLVQQRSQQAADVFLLVVGGDTHTTRNDFVA